MSQTRDTRVSGVRVELALNLPAMPPRKDKDPAAVAVVSTSAQAQQDAASDGIENYELPKTLVTKVAKSAVRSQLMCR